MHLLPTNLGAVADCASKEDTKYAVSGVHIKLNEDNTYRVEATDTRVLAVVTGQCVAEAALHPLAELEPMKAAPNGFSEALINAKKWKDLFAKASKFTKKAARFKPILGSVATVIGEKETTLGMTDLESRPVDRLTNLEGRYPPVNECIPKGTPICKMRFDAKGLAELLKVAAVYTSDGGIVEMQLFGDMRDGYVCKPMLIKSKNTETAQDFVGLMMPR